MAERELRTAQEQLASHRDQQQQGQAVTSGLAERAAQLQAALEEAEEEGRRKEEVRATRRLARLGGAAACASVAVCALASHACVTAPPLPNNSPFSRHTRARWPRAGGCGRRRRRGAGS